MTNYPTNKVSLKGKLHFSKEDFFINSYGIKIYVCTLEVKRLSNTSDFIPVHIPESLFLSVPKNTIFVEIHGSFRSKNIKSKLYLYVFAKTLYKLCYENYFNEILLKGYVCRAFSLRITPLGCTLFDFILKVPGFPSYFIPIISWYNNALELSILDPKTSIFVRGRIQSRNYLKKYEDGLEEEKTAYEVSLNEFFYI